MLVSSAPSDPRKPPPADGFIDGYNVWGPKNQLFWDAIAKWCVASFIFCDSIYVYKAAD
jgi:hypothetical protein